MARRIAVTLIIAIIAVSMLPPLTVLPASANPGPSPGWLAGWRYRMAITIDYPTTISYEVSK